MALNAIRCETAKRLEVGAKRKCLARAQNDANDPSATSSGLRGGGLLSGISDLSTFVPFLSAFCIAFLSFFSFFFSSFFLPMLFVPCHLRYGLIHKLF